MATADATTVHAVAEALRRAVNGSDVNGILACWDEDGIMLPPSHAAVRGRAAIGEYFTRVFAERQLTFRFTESSIEVAGDMAIERLHFSAVATMRGGETIQDAGKGIHVYRRHADGSWRLSQDIWNSDRRPGTAGE